ncbi:hypothetical protein ACXZ71_00900 [Streptococcus agalactiae]
MIIEDEFEKIGQFPREALNFGRSPQKAFITVPKAIFELPPKEKNKALKDLGIDLKEDKVRGGDFM